MGEEAALSPDGLRIAYTPFSNKPQFPGRMRPLKNYRGGTASPIWIADLRDSSILKVERKDEVTFNPMWIGDTIYYLSDRDGLTTIFACDVSGKGVAVGSSIRKKLTSKPLSACGDTIVFDQVRNAESARSQRHLQDHADFHSCRRRFARRATEVRQSE